MANVSITVDSALKERFADLARQTSPSNSRRVVSLLTKPFREDSTESTRDTSLPHAGRRPVGSLKGDVAI